MANELEIAIKAVDHGAKRMLDNLADSAKKLANHSDDLKSKLSPLSNLMGGALKLGAAGVATAIGGLGVAIGSSVSAAMDMEQQLANISASMGTSAEETKALKKLIQDLGFDPQLSVNATEAADAIETLGTAGLSVDEILDGAARSTVLLANATGADFADAAAIASDTMSLWNIEAKDLDKTINSIAGTTVASKFDIDDYRFALAAAGGVAATVGVDFDDFNTTIAAISPSFGSGQDAGTSFKQMLLSLIPKSQEAEDTMRELGLITEDGKNQFFDASGAMKDMSEITDILNRATAGLTEEQKNEKLATVFGSDAMRAAAAIAGMTGEEFLNLKNNQILQTDAAKQAAIRTDTLSGLMGIMGDKIDSVKLVIGDKFMPIWKRLIELFVEQIDKHGPMLIEMFGKLADQLQIGIDKLIPWVEENLPKMIEQIPTVVTHVKEFITELANFAIEAWDAIKPVVEFIAQHTSLKGILIAVAAVMGVSAVMSALSFAASVWGVVSAIGGLVLAFSPLTLAIGAIVLVVAGLYYAWNENFLGIRDITAAAFEKVKEWLSAAGDWLSELPGKIVALYNSWRDNFTYIKDKTAEVFGTVKDWLNNVKTWFTDLPGKIAELGTNFFNAASSIVTKIKDGFNHFKEDAKNALAGVFYSARDRVNTVVEELKNHFFPKAGELVTKIKAGITQFANDPAGAINTVLTNVGTAFDQKTNNTTGLQKVFWTIARDMVWKIRDGFNAVVNDPVGAINTVLTNIGTAFNTKTDNTTGFQKHFWMVARDLTWKIRDGFNAVANDPAGALNAVLSTVERGFNAGTTSLKTHVFSVAKEIPGNIRAGLEAVGLGGVMDTLLNKNIVDTFNRVMDSFKTHVWGVMQEVGSELMGGLIDKIKSMSQALLDAFNFIATYAPQWLKDKLGIHSPSKVFEEIGQNIMGGLTQGINEMAMAPQMALQGATAGMVNGTTNNTYNNGRTTNNNFNVTIPTTGNGANEEGYSLVNTLQVLYA